MREDKLLINNLEANYKIAGEGPAILVLHGWGGSSDSWILVQGILANQGYKVICPDFPGFGKSKTPPEPWDVNDYVNWLNDFIKNLQLDNFVLIAHSFGGRVAVKFVNKYPEKINKLILCASAGIKPKPGLKTRVIYWLAKIGNAVFTPKILTRLKDRARNIFYMFLRHKDYIKADGTMRETIKMVLGEDLLPDLEKIQTSRFAPCNCSAIKKTKTLILWGGADRMVPVKYAYIFKEKIKNSELEIFPKIGHSPHLEIPERLAQKIIEFLK